MKLKALTLEFISTSAPETTAETAERKREEEEAETNHHFKIKVSECEDFTT